MVKVSNLNLPEDLMIKLKAISACSDNQSVIEDSLREFVRITEEKNGREIDCSAVKANMIEGYAVEAT